MSLARTALAPAGRLLCAFALLAPGAAWSLTPLPPCIGQEDGMLTSDLTALDPEYARSGVTVESYRVTVLPDASPQGVYRPQPAPVPELDGFFGVRVTHCASGSFFAIDTNQRPETVAAVLGATEHLRAAVQAGRPVGRSALSDAMRAVYRQAITLRENEETCGCHVTWPELRPASLRPYPERKDAFK